MQGGVHDCTREIMRPYAGIIRIRFMGMISAIKVRHPCRLLCLLAGLAGHLYFFSTILTSYSLGQFFPVR